MSEMNKDQRHTICTSLLCRQQSDPFLIMFVTSDKKWVLYNNNKSTRQWLSSNQVAVASPKSSQFEEGVIMRLVEPRVGVIHFESLKTSETVTVDLYCQQLDLVRNELLVKRLVLINRKGIVLQHNNARSHAARFMICEHTLNRISHPNHLNFIKMEFRVSHQDGKRSSIINSLN